jgi:hypothetical protein
MNCTTRATIVREFRERLAMHLAFALTCVTLSQMVGEPAVIAWFGVAAGLALIIQDYLTRFLNVRWWGASGKGDRDDSEVFQLLLNLASARKNAMVYMPPGRYRLDHTVICGGAGATLEGVDGAIIVANTPDDPTFHVTGKDWFFYNLRGEGVTECFFYMEHKSNITVSPFNKGYPPPKWWPRLVQFFAIPLARLYYRLTRRQPINVRHFGAGLGGDDTRAIQAALDIGGTVYVPKGVHRLSGPLNLVR